MNRLIRVAVTVAMSLSAIVLAGCSSDQGSSAPEYTPTPAESNVLNASSSPIPKLRRIQAFCRNWYNEKVQYSLDAANQLDREFSWKHKDFVCDVGYIVHPVTDMEKAAFESSGYDERNISSLYALCLERIDEEDPKFYSKAAATEMQAALILCPDHPDAKEYRYQISAAIEQSKIDDANIQEGVFRVGSDVKPGTYVTADVEGCYWERQDKNGNITKNFFTNAALRVEVTIYASDYAFYSSGCGTWKPK